MPTNLKLDDKVVAEAVKLGRHKTKRAAVSAALAEYVLRRRQARLEELYGAIEYPADWNPKAMRRAR
jgi:Arc/MetJ family transcription regulator